MNTWNVKEIMKEGGKPENITTYLEQCKLSRLGMNVYETSVSNIPDGRIEWLLWFRGKAMVWYSATAGWIATDCSEVGYDINGWPNKWRPVLDQNIEGIDTPVLSEADKCVVFYDTADYRIKRSDIVYYCGDYADVTETIRTQVFNQKTPLIAVCGSPQIKNKLKNMVVKIAENAKMLFVDRGLKDDIQALDFNAPYNVDSLWQYRKALENDMLEYIGIDSQDAYQKKERLVVDEQEGNDELLNYLLADGLKVRKSACDKLTALGLTASTKIQQIVRPIDAEDMNVPQGGDNGETAETD